MDPMLAGMVQAIEANPGDETTWLVLADWLEDQGEADRAELTRLSISLRKPRSRRGKGRQHQEERLRDLVSRGVSLPLPRRALSLTAGVTMAFVLVPPGSFRMGTTPKERRRDGDEGPAHEVALTRGFWLGVHQVTQEQWAAVLPPHQGRFQGPTLPVDGVSWEQCQEFLAALRGRTGAACRLPSEAEWEYACRACTLTPYSFGPSLSSGQANFDGNYPYGDAGKGPWLERTTPVGSYRPNAFGLYDMHGNVWEWCEDWYAEGYYRRSPERDPTGPGAGEAKVLRGGSWYSYGWSCRSAGRERFSPESGAGNYGCRVALDA
jgi:uncharacterized protein (TIGR02996 family)